MDLCDRIHGVVASLLRAARRWWQAVAQRRRRNPRIPPNKVCAGALEWGCSGQSRLCVMLLLLVAVLPWRETKAMPASASCGFFNKAWVPWIQSCCNPFGLSPLICGRNQSSDGGRILKGRRRRICAVSVCCLAVLPFFMLAAMVVDGRRDAASAGGLRRSEERRVGKECLL